MLPALGGEMPGAIAPFEDAPLSGVEGVDHPMHGAFDDRTVRPLHILRQGRTAGPSVDLRALNHADLRTSLGIT